ncbi:MAG: pseudouridine synthase [Rikenellaceae bacterium]
MLHPLPHNDIEAPKLFTNPFDYVPHPLVDLAREELCSYLIGQQQWHEEIEQGKMFGVLVVEDSEHNIGFLAAFSGYLAKRTRHNYFVPPILDLQEPEGFFKREEFNISQINARIKELDSSEKLQEAKQNHRSIIEEESREVEALKAEYAASRARRRTLRSEGCTIEQLQELNAESQRQKGALRRCELHFAQLRRPLEELLEEHQAQRAELLAERARRSSALQALTFNRFQPLNALGVPKDLMSIFEAYNGSTPPAGSGECAAPKLLHYAFKEGLRPIAMGEFWWGKSTRGEVRRHLHYYAACRGKCHPILSYMLQGLEVEPPHTPTPTHEEALRAALTIIYEDDSIVVFNKPSGLPSVRGLNHTLSVQSIAEELYPEVDPNCIVVHRLDMDTSGVLLIAKNAATQRNLQQQFADHTTRKRYIALLEGIPSTKSGTVELPLILDPLDRPRQRVDFQNGKHAYTYFQVLETLEGYTRIALYPQTGRTHQLRVHCAHPQGINCPIVGDRLYGDAKQRLMLHAEQITLLHPTTGRKFTLRCTPEF